jgi:4-amino-4-deoxy-L-arabinose transferase-like glycosyltransferase
MTGTGKGWGALVLVVLGMAVVRAVAAAQMPVLAAESYYWLWSQQLAAGYFDHPPMVACFIWVGTNLLGDTALGIRLASVLGLLVTSGALWVFARRVVSPAAANLSVIFLSVCLVGFPFGLVVTPDGPLLMFWALSMVAFERAVDRPTILRWLLCGVLTGLTVLSKFTGFGLLAGYGVFLVATPRGRQLLRDPRPWLSLLVTAAVLAPNLLWNQAHGASTLATPFRGYEQESLGLGGRALLSGINLVRLAASSLVIMTPVLLMGWWRASRGALQQARSGDVALSISLCVSWVPYAIFVGLAVIMDIGLHWLAPCFLGALPVVSAWLTDPARPRPGQVRATLIIALLCVIPLLAVPALANSTKVFAPSEEDSWQARFTAVVRGARPLVARLREEAAGHEGPLLIITDDYHLSSLMAWHLNRDGGEHLPTLPLKRLRFRQLENWYVDGQYDGWDAIYVEEDDGKAPTAALQGAFEQVTILEPEVLMVDGVPAGRWLLYRGEGFRGPVMPGRQRR